MTVQAVMVLIAAGNCVSPSLAPVMVGIAQHESGLDPLAVHHNANGTLDVGIAQINTSNFAWLGLTMQSALDPCQNLAAGAKVLFARYNGSPPDSVRAASAAAVTNQIRALDGVNATTIETPPPCPTQEDDGWHTAALPPGCPDPTTTEEPDHDAEK